MATKPRQILPGRTWFVTGRAIARQHRFVPEDRVVETLWYCLAVAVQKYSVQMHGFVWMSNHYHLVLTDSAAELPDFMRDLNSLISKALNAFRGVRGQNFERSGYNGVVVADGGKLLSHCAYTEANPCRAGLVDLASQWESVSSANLEYGQQVSVHRPNYGLWSQAKSSGNPDMDPTRAMHCGRIKCPEVAEFRLVRPPCLNGESETVTRAEVRGRVKVLEDEARALRKKSGRSVMGMEQVKEMDFWVAPSSRESFFGTEPTVSGENAEERGAVRRGIEEFLARYKAALDEYREKGSALFPEGTWWMRRCLRTQCYAYCESG